MNHFIEELNIKLVLVPCAFALFFLIRVWS